ncbi:MAG TPA: M15 family metallopeptidase [Candidatus Paceibacterota bacterium]|nr:M15 family metallopeptidase [Candidatus Paceibacterota bacterium]
MRNGTLKVGTCYNPNDYAIGQTAQQAIAYLRTKLTGAAAQRGDVSVTRMNKTFACRLADFLKASESVGDIKIFSGWRDEAAQQQAVSVSRAGYACRSGASCPHPQGRAADLTFNGLVPKTHAECNALPACRWAHANASRFNLVFPLSGNPLEPWHIEPVERSSVPQNGPCGGSGGASAAASPFRVADYVRQALGMQQQPPPPPQPQLAPQPLPQQQSILDSFQPSTQLIPQGSTQTGTSNQTGTNTNTNTNNNSNTNTSSSPISVIDQLNELAFGTTSQPTTGTSATTAPLVIVGATVGGLVPTSNSTSTQFNSSGNLAVVGQQTFTSNDLRWQPNQTNTPIPGTEQYSRLVQLYTALRDVLVRILEYLKPFSSLRSAQPIDIEHVNEYTELD